MSTEAPSPPEHVDHPQIGTVDVMEIYLGARGSGKSVAMCARARELCRELGGAYVIGHSIGQRLPSSLPAAVAGGGAPALPITYHRSVGELERGLKSKPNRWHIIAPPLADEDAHPDRPRSSADDLIRYSVRLSKAIRDQAWKHEHPIRGLAGVPAKATYTGLKAPPVIVLIDEGVAVAGAAGGDRGKGEKTDWFREILISLRHLHIIVLYCAQGATMRSWHMLEQATAIHCYQTTHEIALNAIRQAGADADELEQIRRLPLYSYVTVVPIAKAGRGGGASVTTDTGKA